MYKINNVWDCKFPLQYCFYILLLHWQMLSYFPLLMIFAEIRAETNTGNCKDMLQGYLTGQLSSALGVYQVEALRREFKSFTEVIEKQVKKDLNSKGNYVRHISRWFYGIKLLLRSYLCAKIFCFEFEYNIKKNRNWNILELRVQLWKIYKYLTCSFYRIN